MGAAPLDVELRFVQDNGLKMLVNSLSLATFVQNQLQILPITLASRSIWQRCYQESLKGNRSGHDS